MQFSFLGYSVKKIIEFKLDVKDVTILKYFDDFRKSGRMNYQVIEGVKYYWISYQNIENELPFLGLGKRTIMMRMLKLRDLGILSHYTKKEGGTFSFYALGERYKELVYIKESNNDNSSDEQANYCNDDINEEDIYNINNKSNSIISDIQASKKEAINNEEDVLINRQGVNELDNLYANNYKNEERMSLNNHKGYSEKCSTNTHLLNNSSTIVTNIYNIQDEVISIIDYLNLKAGVMYRTNNTKIIGLIRARLKEGFTMEDFKTVIDKKVKDWKGSIFEKYLTPFTLFGDKFEVYLNQKVLREEGKKLRFHNFKGRDYDYDKLEKQLLGWA